MENIISRVSYTALLLNAKLQPLQASAIPMETGNLTLGFDDTTQEGTPDSIHLTTAVMCVVVAIDQLAGGTAEDYARHICHILPMLLTNLPFCTEASTI